jgi:hypothetical protein
MKTHQIAASRASDDGTTTAAPANVVIPIASKISSAIIPTTDVPIALAVPITRDDGRNPTSTRVTVAVPGAHAQGARSGVVTNGGRENMDGQRGGTERGGRRRKGGFGENVRKQTWRGCKMVIGNLVYIITPIRIDDY